MNIIIKNAVSARTVMNGGNNGPATPKNSVTTSAEMVNTILMYFRPRRTETELHTGIFTGNHPPVPLGFRLYQTGDLYTPPRPGSAMAKVINQKNAG